MHSRTGARAAPQTHWQAGSQSFLIRPSPCLRRLTAAMALANLLVAWLMAVWWPAGPAILIWAAWAGFIAVRSAADLRARQPVRLRFDVSGVRCWQDDGAGPVKVELARMVCLGAAFMTLELRQPGGVRFHIPVAADSLPDCRHRALRVAASTALRGCQ